MDLQLQRLRAHRSGVEAGGQEQLRAGSVWKPLGLQWNWSDRRHRPQPGLLLRPAGQRRNPRSFPYSCPILGCLAPQVVKTVGESRECDPEKSRNKTRGSVSQSALGSPLSRGLPGNTCCLLVITIGTAFSWMNYVVFCQQMHSPIGWRLTHNATPN